METELQFAEKTHPDKWRIVHPSWPLEMVGINQLLFMAAQKSDFGQKRYLFRIYIKDPMLRAIWEAQNGQAKEAQK